MPSMYHLEMMFVCTLGKRLHTAITIWKVWKNLQRATKMATETGGGILFITRRVFGMRGQQGKLKKFVALKEKYNFRLLVDDAFGLEP
jgi:7-keto-8-aminopelargonate synthetase-like enzyme